MTEQAWSARDLIVVAAARRLAAARTCFAGIGLPSAAAILAQRTHAPSIYLVFESGVLGARPGDLPLSVADQELADTAQAIVSVPEIFAYWLQPGRIDVGMLGAAQVDRFGNINSTVIGPYESPKVRLPGAGGAPEIAAACRETVVLVEHGRRSLVADVDFVTTVGSGPEPGTRAALGFRGAGPRAVVTDLAMLELDPSTMELTVTGLQPGVGLEEVREATGWPVRTAPRVTTLDPPTAAELTTLRALERPVGGTNQASRSDRA